MPLLLTFLLAIGVHTAPAAGLPPTAKVIFPTQDDFNRYTGSASGCDHPPELLEPLARHIANIAPRNFVPYNIAGLNRKGVMGLYYVYSAKACNRLRRYFPSANVFVMARVTLRKCDFLPDGTTSGFFDVEAKIYSLASGREEVIFQQRDVAREQVGTLLLGKEVALLEKIVSVISHEPPPNSRLQRTRPATDSAGATISRGPRR
jgi:hypothetical protein